MRNHLPVTPARARHLYLTGFMGAGKTAVGRHVAERLGWEFIDLDQALEARHNRTVADIWAELGEPVFRRWETEIFGDLARAETPLVLATGGGTFIDLVNFDLARHTGRTVYLIVDFPTALERLRYSSVARPQLPIGPGAESQLRRLFRQRLPFYRMAEIHTDASYGTPEDIADRLLVALGQCIS